jgi:3-hydroxy-9,10-secoandrosta-1,3,5(10)-triene-9,17-dione monooxygenase reductase component
LDEPQARIHDTDPFKAPMASRKPARRLRGRLAAPVTIWTAGPPDARTGLTISSLLVIEAEPASVIGLVSDTSDLWFALTETGTFIVHVLDEGGRTLAERFAGLRPSPGGLFVDLEVDDTEHGPVIKSLSTRAHCRVEATEQLGFHRLVRGSIESMDLGDDPPLVYHRGRFRKLHEEI